MNVIPKAAKDHIYGMNGCDSACVYGKISGRSMLTVDWNGNIKDEQAIHNTWTTALYIHEENKWIVGWNTDEVEINVKSDWLRKYKKEGCESRD